MNDYTHIHNHNHQSGDQDDDNECDCPDCCEERQDAEDDAMRAQTSFIHAIATRLDDGDQATPMRVLIIGNGDIETYEKVCAMMHGHYETRMASRGVVVTVRDSRDGGGDLYTFVYQGNSLGFSGKGGSILVNGNWSATDIVWLFKNAPTSASAPAASASSPD